MVHKRTVLIVDDCPEDREIYRRYLQQDQVNDYQILEEESGERGLALCRSQKLDIILLDFLLPDLDGLDFLTELKQETEKPLPATIILTDQGNEDVAVQVMKKGAQDYLVKGKITSENLQMAVSNVIENTELRQQLQQSKAALAENQQFIESLIATTPGLVYVYNLVNRCNIYVNHQIAELLGYSPQEIQKMGTELCAKIIYPEDLVNLLIVAEQLKSLPDGEIIEVEYRVLNKSGEWRWLCGRETVFTRNSDGLPSQIIGTALDITKRKQVERERTELLEKEKVARAAAEAANNAKDEFVAMVSHDLGNPLNAILGWTALLRTRKLDDDIVDRAIAIIERNARFQATLVADLLDMSRIIRGKLKLEMEPVNLVAIVETAIETAFPGAKAKQIYLESALDHSLEMIWADSNRLQQVLGNLLSNAIKFTPEGGKIKVSLESNQGFAEIVVSDTGSGISAEFLPNVFERYRQADRLNRKGGLGLGLAIARHLVELHGGTIQVASPGEGQGTTFTITLPVKYSGLLR